MFRLGLLEYPLLQDIQFSTILDWFQLFQKHYPHNVWLNPSTGGRSLWHDDYWSVGSHYDLSTYDILNDKFDMYLLTVANLEKALKKLLVSR